MPLTSDSLIRLREVGSRLSAAFKAGQGGWGSIGRCLRTVSGVAGGIRARTSISYWVIHRQRSGATIQYGNLSETLVRAAPVCCNSDWADAATSTCSGTQLVVAKPTLVVAYGGTLQISYG